MAHRITRGTVAVTRGSALKIMAVPEQHPRRIRAAHRSDQPSRRFFGGMVVCNLAKVHTITTALPEQKQTDPAELADVYTKMALAEQRKCQPLVDIQKH